MAEYCNHLIVEDLLKTNKSESAYFTLIQPQYLGLDTGFLQVVGASKILLTKRSEAKKV